MDEEGKTTIRVVDEEGELLFSFASSTVPRPDDIIELSIQEDPYAQFRYRVIAQPEWAVVWLMDKNCTECEEAWVTVRVTHVD